MYYLLLEICIVWPIFLSSTKVELAKNITSTEPSPVTADISISPTRPIRNGNVTIFCSTSVTVEFYNTQIKNTSLAVCNSSSCTNNTFSLDGSTIYQFGTNGPISWLYILSLNRTRDQTMWRCQYSPSFEDIINLTVYTPPSEMIYTSLPPSTDLAQTSLTLACQTDRCIYPEPQIAWYESNGSIYFNTNSSTMSSNSSTCSQSEQIYTSTLRISLGTVFPGNVNTTKKLKCGALHPAIDGQLFTQPSNDIIFAVSLTYINISGPTNVTNGTEVNFTCVTSVSRPLYSVNWRIGNRNITAGVANFNRTTYAESRLTFVVDDIMHHDNEIICEVYTILATTVRSESRRLYVRVPVFSVSLRPANSTITAMEGSENLFECTTSVGRPAPLVRWWLGSTQLFNFSSDQSIINGTLVSIRSVLTLPINRTHQNQTIFCQAWVTDQSTVVESSKPVLNIWYPPSVPMVRPFSKGFPWLENSTGRLECFASDRGNPRSSVIWNTTRGTDDANQQRVIENLGANDNEVKVQCQLQNSYTKAKNISLISAVISLIVEYAPTISVQVIDLTTQERRISVQCSARGLPAFYTFNSWVHMFENVVIRSGLQGTEANSTSVLNIYNATLEDMGKYVCSAANGIMGLNGNLFQSNTSDLYVKGSPNIFTEQQYITGQVGQSINISIQFYSYTSRSNITIKRNGIIINDTGRITRSMASYNFTMYNKTVQLRIQMAHFITSDLKEEDFGRYALQFTNDVGTTEFIVDLKASEATGDARVGSIVGGVLGSVASLTIVAIIVFVLKRRGFQLNHRKVISYIQSKLTKRDHDSSTGNIEPEYANTVRTVTDKEKIYEDLRKRGSSDNPYVGFQADNSNDKYGRGSATYVNQQDYSHANVEVHTYDNIGHVNHDDKIYQNTSI